ncbi:MAG TPA: hypothetical protein VGC13_18085 [Longimicrobium sp.]|jgi:ppGpp synthetase/RelA/SpoT-type nucleotidyltranferase
MVMLEKNRFLEKYRIPEDKLADSKLDWEELSAIHDEFISSQPHFLAAANYISERLQALPDVHSIKLRVKDPEHVVEKIIRKRIADPNRDIGLHNFKTELTDLIGLRALHLFKDGWRPIHDAVSGTWDLYEVPVANVRRGDPEELIQEFRSAGCEINEHEFGYRSIHYLVRSQPAKQEYIAEIQVRTIFEEGWSEIDHQIRYPYDIENTILGQFLVMFNRLAGSADEMGSFVKLLKRELHDRETAATVALTEKNTLINNLQEQIAQLKVAKQEKDKLKRSVEEIQRTIVSPVTLALNESAAAAVLSAAANRLSFDSSVFASIAAADDRFSNFRDSVLRSSVAVESPIAKAAAQAMTPATSVAIAAAARGASPEGKKTE